LATEPSPQRGYRAACPNCGAPVEFRSAASAFAVCSFCRSTIVRDGEALRRIGQSAELFDDHSPLQLGAAGRYQGQPFVLVGRLQYRYADGTWNEWHALFDSGTDGQKSGWLSEDNGRYVFAFDAPPGDTLPPAEKLRPGQAVTVAAQSWTVASVVTSKLIAAQGELPQPPQLERAFVVADLRSARDEVGTIDYSEPAAPKWSVGRSVAISELAMTGLAEASEKTLKARGIACPSCGTAIEVKLTTTQSVVCHQCHAVIDLSKGVGGELQHYAQQNGSEPLIPLGSTGALQLTAKTLEHWQVVGYAERCEVPEDPDDEQVFWREYLVYHRTHGFTFIVDSEDGWSWAAPITGAPERVSEIVRYQGEAYKKLYSYTGKVTYVLGEFYWKLERDQTTRNTDYQGVTSISHKRLNREETSSDGAHEVVWSAGATLTADEVMRAFKLQREQRGAMQRDAGATSGNAASLLAKVFFWGFLAVVALMLFRCDDDNPRQQCDDTRNTFGEASAEYQNCLRSTSGSGGSRTSGGSFGGFSSGGGHK
jgi:hypothetical protein